MILNNVRACRKVLSAPWDVTITPLDTCGLVRLTGQKYAKARDSGWRATGEYLGLVGDLAGYGSYQ